jgi:hypothetical protein
MQHKFETNNVRWRKQLAQGILVVQFVSRTLSTNHSTAIAILLQAKQVVHTRAGDVSSKQQTARANTKRAIEPKSGMAKETSTAALLPGVSSDLLASMAIPNDLIGATVILHSPS